MVERVPRPRFLPPAVPLPAANCVPEGDGQPRHDVFIVGSSVPSKGYGSLCSDGSLLSLKLYSSRFPSTLGAPRWSGSSCCFSSGHGCSRSRRCGSCGCSGSGATSGWPTTSRTLLQYRYSIGNLAPSLDDSKLFGNRRYTQSSKMVGGICLDR